MKTLMKYISLVAVLVLLLCVGTSVCAEDLQCYFTNEAGTTVMHGGVSLGEQSHKTDVTVSVYDENGNLNFRSVLIAGTDGKVEFSYINDGASGDYTCYFAIRSLNLVKSAVCRNFKGNDYWQNLVNSCNTYAQNQQPAELVNLILENKELLDVDMELYEALTSMTADQKPSAVGKIMLADYFKNYPQTAEFTQYADTKDIINAFEGAASVAYINENQNGDAAKKIWTKDAEKSCLNLVQEMPAGEKTAVLDELSSVTKEAVFAVIGSKTYASAASLAEEFITNTLFNAIAKADNYGDVRKVLVAYDKADKINVNISGNSTVYVTVYKNMQNKPYTTFKAVEDDFARNLAAANQSSAPSGGGGGGGGGGFFKPATEADSSTNESSAEVTANAEKPHTAPMYFNDIEDSKWALSAINYWYEQGVIAGNGAGGFEPARNVNRSEMAKMIVGWRGYELPKTTPGFSDMEAGAWYVPYVAAAYENKLFNGYEDGSFGVSAGITRQEAACVIYRLISAEGNIKKQYGQSFSFEDDKKIESWAKEAVYSLYNAGVINGRSEKLYAPDELMTRAEAAMLMYKAKQYLDA